jgi:hydrogenase expression/formation protein HypC
MCIGLPMQVQSVSPGHALVQGRGETRKVNTALVVPPAPGDWLLVFLDSARESLSPERAAEINAALDLLADAMAGLLPGPYSLAADPGFALPSAMSAAQLAALTGQPS